MLIIVDRRAVEASDARPSYELRVYCMNCGQVHVAQFLKGQKPEFTYDGCPHCEVTGRLAYGTSPQAVEERRLAVSVETYVEQGGRWLSLGDQTPKPLRTRVYPCPPDAFPAQVIPCD